MAPKTAEHDPTDPQDGQDGQRVPRVNDETDFGVILRRLRGRSLGSLGGPWALLGHHVAVLGPSWAAKNMKHGMSKNIVKHNRK